MNVALKSSVETGADRRAFGRRETQMPATVRLPNHINHDCIICDISEGGALLEFPSRVEVAGRLRLSFDGGNQEIICEVRHTCGNRVGVEFARNIALAARPIAAPAGTTAPLAPDRRPVAAPENSRLTAASSLVASRRNAAKALVAKHDAIIEVELLPILVEVPVVIDAPVPRDMTSLLQSVAALAAERAVPRPLPARAYATALVLELTEVVVPRDMSSVFNSVAVLLAVRAVPRPLPACGYAHIPA